MPKQDEGSAMNDLIVRLSARGQNAFPMMAIVREIARVDGWESLDACLMQSTAIVDSYIAYADAALRAINGFSGKETQHR